ncbi:unnamed protein product, partial [Mesorhabditis belari]|uniref:Vitellogenin n=1 Tax=Mesorhabditis belari TaxID=2138241 RepID=A0AAF3EN47_9BILA
MKLLAAFGLLAIALAASSRQWEERSFNKGNTYEFEWKGQIVSGVPVKGSSSHSLQQIHSKVFITVNEKHSILRLDNVKLTNGHKQLTEPRIISEVSLEESQLTSEQREQIKLPIRFRYHQGIISEIVFSEEESAWSENIKRSILNMLQVQMSPRKTQEEYNTKTVSNNKFFTVTERTLEGECEVAYTIVESEKNREEKEITKSLNFEKCPKRIDIRYGPRYSAECSMCEATDARPESQTVISYKVRGEDEERFLITEVELKSEYVFSPFSKDQEMLATYVHQKMRLVNIKSAERVEEPRNGKKSSLLYNYEMELAREKFWMNGDEQSYTLTGFAGVPKKELMDKYIRLTLASMEESEKDGVTLETNHNFARIVEVFRMCTEREKVIYDRRQPLVVRQAAVDSLRMLRDQMPRKEQLIEKIVRSDSSISSSEMIRKIAKGFRFEGVLSGYVYEHVRIVPTTLGLPLQVTSKLPTVAHIKAHIKAEISPKMSLRVEMEPSFVSTHVTEMTVFSPEMDIGSRVFHSIQSTLPIHGQVEYNDEKQQLKAVLRLPKEEKRVLLVESRPTTFVRSFNNKQVPVLEEKTIRIPSFEKTSVHYEKSYGEEHFGLRTEVIGSVHRHVFDKKTPESILFGENHVQIVLIPTAESVKEIVLEVEPKYTKMASSEYESPRYDEIFTEKEFEKEIECELKQEKIVCKVDGRRVEDEEALYDMGIKLIGESSCEITIPKMTIRFDGYKVEIKADKRTENTQCGLCGHFDGRRDNEFRRADNEETEDIEEFHRSWLRRDNECEVEESKLKEKKNYGVESDEEERYDSEESFWNPRQDFEEENMGEKRSRKMLKKNLKKHISRKNIRNEEENTYEPENEIVMVEREGKTCFSMEEQPKCQPGDELIETENRKVKLACLPRSDRRTRRIVNGLKRGEESIMEEIRSLPMSLTDRIELPKLCRVY